MKIVAHPIVLGCAELPARLPIEIVTYGVATVKVRVFASPEDSGTEMFAPTEILQPALNQK